MQEEYYSCEIFKNNFIVRDNGCWKSFDLTGKELKNSKKRKSVLPNENNSQKKETTKKLILDEKPINSKYEDPNIKIIREQLNYLDNIKNIYEEISSTYDNFNKTIRINKIKSELHITNSEIATFFKIIGINFIDNPNAKLTESEYFFIKTIKEKNIEQKEQKQNNLYYYEYCIASYDNHDKSIRLIKVLKEFNINLRTVINIFKNIIKKENLNPNSKITLAEYMFIKTVKEKNI